MLAPLAWSPSDREKGMGVRVPATTGGTPAPVPLCHDGTCAEVVNPYNAVVLEFGLEIGCDGGGGGS
jgi:hypothetical protein